METYIIKNLSEMELKVIKASLDSALEAPLSRDFKMFIQSARVKVEKSILSV